MSFEAKFVAIGGKSSVGKTTLINNLVYLYPGLFKRPTSYTTRPRRVGEDESEYFFISKSEMKVLHEQGKLANLDLNYGNYYAMDKYGLLRDMESLDTIIIKEIHPRYHEKMKNLLGDNCISALIIGLEAESKGGERNSEDDDYYRVHTKNEYDIVYTYDKSISPEDNAKDFYRRLLAYINTAKQFPPAKSIDEKNTIGYSKVATEFTEEKRITTRNFHEASKKFWDSVISKIHGGRTVLELGPGNGWLQKSFTWPNVNYLCADIVSDMEAVSRSKSGLQASARCLPLRARSVDYVVASLADPYFYPEMLCEVNRILKEGAHFIATLPDKEWADNLRGANHHETSFLLDSGLTATVFSFTFSDSEIINLAENCGFLVCHLLHFEGTLLGNEISPAITRAAEKAGKPISNLRVITAIVLEKRG